MLYMQSLVATNQSTQKDKICGDLDIDKYNTSGSLFVCMKTHSTQEGAN